MKEKSTKLLVLDLDGTVRKGFDELGKWVNGPSDVEVFPEAVVMMRRWKEGGGRIVALSNQGRIALGHVAIDDVAAAMVETQRQCGGMFDRIVFCCHHPDAADPEMARCWCRKPAIGGLVGAGLDLSRQFGEMYPPHLALFVGDRPEDEECARNCSIDFMHAAEWRKLATN